MATVFSYPYGLLMIILLTKMIFDATLNAALDFTLALVFISSLVLLAGMLHPREIFYLITGIIYYAAIPCMYIFLIIYAAFNMDVLSWGTREVKTDPQKEVKSRYLRGSLQNVLFLQNQRNSGNILTKWFNIKRTKSTEPVPAELQVKLEAIADKLNDLESVITNERESAVVEVTSDVHSESGIESVESTDDFLVNDGFAGETRFLASKELMFWNEVIDKYLSPTVYDEVSCTSATHSYLI